MLVDQSQDISAPTIAFGFAIFCPLVTVRRRQRDAQFIHQCEIINYLAGSLITGEAGLHVDQRHHAVVQETLDSFTSFRYQLGATEFQFGQLIRIG